MDARARIPGVVRDRRRIHRYIVDVAAYLSGSILRRRRKAVVKDLSIFGCRVTTAGRFNPGDFVMLLVPSFGPFGARIAWAADGDVGLEFVHALDPAVVTKIVAMRTTVVCPIERRWRSLDPVTDDGA